jgi:ubiquinone/menaquinone biosynthesis C-methylase UbiE
MYHVLDDGTRGRENGRVQNIRLLTCVILVAATLDAGVLAARQLASRPAEEWTKVLDAANRVAGLRIDEIVPRLQLKPGDVVADIGAGSGLFEVQLAKAVSPGGTVYAVDIDEGFFADIQKRAAEAGLNNVRTVLGKFTDPNLPVKNVDVVFFHDVLHHVEDRAAYLKSLGPYLKPAGRVVIIDYEAGQGPHGKQPELQVTREQLAPWMTAAGFRQSDDIKLFSDRYYLVFSKR